jgi:hypothetical protein
MEGDGSASEEPPQDKNVNLNLNHCNYITFINDSQRPLKMVIHSGWVSPVH